MDKIRILGRKESLGGEEKFSTLINPNNHSHFLIFLLNINVGP
jgi:hypothetical protein